MGSSVAPATAISSIWSHRALILGMGWREVFGRYRGSIFGLLWSFLNPMLMLGIYTFVFSIVFRARWNSGSDSRTEFAVVLFAGLMVYSLFAEVINRSPTLILNNVNFVKKVVFPLEILSIVALFAALFHLGVSFLVWLLAYLVFFGVPSVTAVFFPMLLIPLCLFTLGFSWFLASLGVYLRDVGQVVGVLTTMLLFLSPIFYPVAMLPPAFQAVLHLNPLTFIVEQARGVLMWGAFPDWTGLFLLTCLSAVVAYLGFAWFQKTRGGFADVL